MDASYVWYADPKYTKDTSERLSHDVTKIHINIYVYKLLVAMNTFIYF